jgi:hypothetical protein
LKVAPNNLAALIEKMRYAAKAGDTAGTGEYS